MSLLRTMNRYALFRPPPRYGAADNHDSSDNDGYIEIMIRQINELQAITQRMASTEWSTETKQELKHKSLVSS